MGYCEGARLAIVEGWQVVATQKREIFSANLLNKQGVARDVFANVRSRMMLIGRPVVFLPRRHSADIQGDVRALSA